MITWVLNAFKTLKGDSDYMGGFMTFGSICTSGVDWSVRGTGEQFFVVATAEGDGAFSAAAEGDRDSSLLPKETGVSRCEQKRSPTRRGSELSAAAWSC